MLASECLKQCAPCRISDRASAGVAHEYSEFVVDRLRQSDSGGDGAF